MIEQQVDGRSSSWKGWSVTRMFFELYFRDKTGRARMAFSGAGGESI